MEYMEMHLLGLKIISLTGNNIYSTMVIYQKLSQSSEVFHKDPFSVEHGFYAILVLSSMLIIH